MEERVSLGLCMIARNEEKTIERCIASVKELVDEIVLVDTGSTDHTVELAEKLGARVYHYTWDDNFAHARNFAISKAASDWLLLLDADEELDKGSLAVIREFIATSDLDGAHLRMRNYTGCYCPDNFTLHSALRLLRNNRQYRFQGAIHEQIVSDGREKFSDRFVALDAVVHHYGYLDTAVSEKNKRRRNIPLIEQELAARPGDPFTLFNMGNEYLSLSNYQTALDYYQQALVQTADRRVAFVPHLFFRMITCYTVLDRTQQALSIIGEGLKEYPACTDYEYLRADLLLKYKRYTLAIASMEKCLKMGNPPMHMEFLPGCGTYRPACQLGELYYELEDYAQAIKYFSLALSHKPNLYLALYRIGAALNRLLDDKNEVREKLFSYFADPTYTPNALLGADILIDEGLYEQALKALTGLNDTVGREVELDYGRGRALFYQQRFDQARALLDSVCQSPPAGPTILTGIRPRSAAALFALGLMENEPELLERALGYFEHYGKRQEYAATALMRDIFLRRPVEDPQFAEEGRRELEAMLGILDMLLKCRRLELFERMLRALNYVDGKQVLLRLAQLYNDNGFSQLAAEYVLRSIKELDYLDAAGAAILFRQVL